MFNSSFSPITFFSPFPAEQLDKMMRIIRAGVTLRPVTTSRPSTSTSSSLAGAGSRQSLVDRHTEQLRQAFARISDRLRGSDDDDDDEQDSDFDNCDYFD